MSADETRRIGDEAAEWMGARDGGLTPERQAEFQRWLRADRRHAEAWGRLERCSLALDRLAARQPRRAMPPARRRRRPALALAAAAALAVAALFVWRGANAPEVARVAVAPAGDTREVALPDGSKILLNAGSEVAVAYRADARAVELVRGEAHFTVAKDGRRPFVVRVGGVAVRAVGTAFNVRRQADAVEVLVTEGRVDVQGTGDGRSLLGGTGTPTEPAPVLVAGQRVRVTGIAGGAGSAPVTAPVETVAAAEVERRLAWRERRLELGPTPLERLVAEFNRTSPVRLTVADPAIAQVSVGGAFRLGDAETLVQLLETNFDIVAERRGDEIRLRRAAAPGGGPAPRE